MLLVALSWLAATASGQSKPGAGERFAAVKTNFESDVKDLAKTRGVEDGYNPGDVNATLRQAKEATLSSIPPKDKPLRVYVERSFPQPVDESAPVAQKQEVEKRFSLVRDLLSKLSGLDSFRLDLTVNTNPPKARFELVPRVGVPLLSTTNGRLTTSTAGNTTTTLPRRDTSEFMKPSTSSSVREACSSANYNRTLGRKRLCRAIFGK